LKYEIKNENNFAVFATFVKRSRNEMLTMVARFQHVLSNDLSSRMHGHISGIVFSATLDHAQNLVAVEDRFHC